MILCSCHGLHGCVPVAPSVTPSLSVSSRSWARRSGIRVTTSAKVPPGPDLDLRCDQLADEIRLELGALRGGFESSKRFVSDRVSGSRIANSSSTATVKSCADSYSSYAFWSRSAATSRLREGLQEPIAT